MNRKLTAILITLFLTAMACSLPAPRETPTPAPGDVPTAAPTATLAPTPTAQPLPPEVIYVDPAPGGELPLRSPITLIFNQPMDQRSVEGALSGDPALTGEFRWIDNRSVSFMPSQAYLPETTLELSLGETAKATNGLAMRTTASFAYQTTGYLRLTDAIPEPGAADVDARAAVVAAFNRPIVPLGADPDTLPAAFTLDPAVNGTGRWINTSTYQFTPATGLFGGTTYEVTLNPELQSTKGGSLDGRTVWAFSTAAPRLVSMTPSSEASVRLNPEIQLTFNQPMNPDSVDEYFALSLGLGEIRGDLSWNDTQTEFTFIPSELLTPNTSYALRVREGAVSVGGAALGETTTTGFTTHPAFAVSGLDGYSLDFTAPLDPLLAFRDFIRVTPAVSDLQLFYQEYSTSLYLSGSFTPATEYQVTILGNLPDVYGNALGETTTVRFVTPPLNPSFFIGGNGTEQFLTRADSGLVVSVANVFQTTVTQAPITLSEMFNLTASGNYQLRQDYQPTNGETFVYNLPVQENVSANVPVPLTQTETGLTEGLYFVRFQPSADVFAPSPLVVIVSDYHLLYKVSERDALVWAVSLVDGRPAVNAPITLYDGDGNVLARGQTNADGVFRTEIDPLDDPYSATYAVLGEIGSRWFSVAFSTWDTSYFGYNFPVNYSPPESYTYLYTDRPIYRPGQTVYYRAIHRDKFDGRYSLSPNSSVSITAVDGQGRELDQQTLSLSAFGSASGELVIPENAEPGYYRLFSEFGSVGYQVAEYRKPEIDVQVTWNQEAGQYGDPLQATVQADYYFGAPASGVEVEWWAYAERAYFSIPGYQVGSDSFPMSLSIFPPFLGGGEQIATGTGQTNADGQLIIDVPVNVCADDKTSDPCTIRLEATITDESGFPTSNRAQTLLHPDQTYVGVRPDSSVGRAGEPMQFDLQTVDWATTPVSGAEIQLRFDRVEWLRLPNIDGLPGDWVPSYIQIAQERVAAGANGTASARFTPTDPGQYQLTAQVGNAVTEVTLWVGGSGQVIWPSTDDQTITLATDRTEYAPGDTAEIFIPNPFLGDGLALISLERSVIQQYEVIPLTGAGFTYELPLTDAHAPNVFLSVTLLDAENRGLRRGTVNILVVPTVQTLDVGIQNDTPTAQPGESATIRLVVRDRAGNPVAGEFAVSVVDEATLALAEPNAPDILDAFYGEQPLGVRTGTAFSAYRTAEVAMEAGGLGGGGGFGLPPSVREDFRDTAYWNGTIVTDANGEATITFALPDNLTTWRVDVRGITADSKVGQGQSAVVTTKDLLVQPVVPRFAVVGDRFPLAAIVHNNTERSLDVTVSLSASGFTLDDPTLAFQTITLAASERARVDWFGTVDSVDELDITMTANAGSLVDAVRPNGGIIPVQQYNAPQTYGTSGVMTTGGSQLELVSMPPDAAMVGELRVEMASSLVGALTSSLDVLEQTDLRSTEQTASRLLANVESYRAVRELGLDVTDLEARLTRTLAEGLQTLAETQQSDGGWVWWPDCQNCESDPYITSYVVLALARAQQLGADVDAGVLSNGAEYLRVTQTPPSMTPEPWQLDRLAFSQFALVEAGQGNLSELASLYEVRDQLNPWARALLALSIVGIAPQDARAQTLFADLEGLAVRSASGVSWNLENPDFVNMTTSTYNHAVVLYALARTDPAISWLPDAARYLVTLRNAEGGWDSTFATAWSTMALTAYGQGTGELQGDFSFTANLNGSQIALGDAAPQNATNVVRALVSTDRMYAELPNALTLTRSDGTGRLYYRAFLDVNMPVNAVAAQDQGIALERTYYAFTPDCDDTCPVVTQAQVGDVVKVELTVVLADDVHFLQVRDHFPAGTEVLDASLQTSQQLPGVGGPVPFYAGDAPFGGGWGWWNFFAPTIRDDNIQWAADFLAAGTYTFSYNLSVTQTGQYHVLPANANAVYFPDFRGNSAGILFEIAPAE